jgi:CheY-like chemotaxis protein
MRPVLTFTITGILLFLAMAAPVSARDFIVEFVEENYRETQQAYSNEPVIYHSVQIKSDAGPKLLVLTGDDKAYRRWIRHFIAQDKTFIARVPEEENDRFISSKAYDINVTRIHPFNGRKWSPGRALLAQDGKESNRGAHMLYGNRHILIIDKSTKRSRLITSVINRMGYTAMVSHNGPQALGTFKIQPEKFKMIIAHYDTPGMPAEELIGSIIKVDHQIPILLETGYNNPRTRKKYVSEFSGAGTVTIKPVVLENLQKTIKQLVREDSGPDTGKRAGNTMEQGRANG